MNNWKKKIHEREKEPLYHLLKEATDMIENLFVLSQKDLMDKEAILKALEDNLKYGGTINRVGDLQKRIKKGLEEFRLGFIPDYKKTPKFPMSQKYRLVKPPELKERK